MPKICHLAACAAVCLSLGAAARAENVPFESGLIIQSLDRIFSVEAADIDDDGDMDLISTSFFTDTIAWYENVGGGINGWVRHIVATDPDGNGMMTGFSDGPVDAYPGDFDGDGDIDIAVASVFDDQIAWYESDGAAIPTWTPHVVGLVEEPSSVFAADVDLDDDIDILSTGFLNGQVTVHRNNGGASPTFSNQIESLNAFGATDVYVVDMDNDGDPDIVSSSANDGKIAWYENLGGQPAIFVERSPAAVSLDGANSVRAADMDGDSDIDFVTAAFDDDTVYWLENIGGSPMSFMDHIVDSKIRGATSAAIADIDKDNDFDIIATGESNDQVIWYEKLGVGASAFEGHGLTTDPDGRLNPQEGPANGAQQVIAVDYDGDGDLDLVSASRFILFGLMAFSNQKVTTPADFNADGTVDGEDLAFILAAWGTSDAQADLNGDGTVDGMDLAAVLAAWTL